MSRKRTEVYRSEEGVLHCGHGRKLHLVCEHCQAEEVENNEQSELFWARVKSGVTAFVLGFFLALMITLMRQL